ncbi:PAS domain-containing sensor histidine kinase [Rhizobium sp. PL01]|uniref:PAS domain-containing sensor histidine kinase n=1 Tax=Rhizobium sp. PL01 TaxID=3085631 RepID=UPI002982B31D|nr:PAS domain-containing sensor histidine kinase [Rhizobium sp. PL01]MDW5318471.1 PAS domain-containing sensor histidine kinase [Rhizobium sp. PL01]
MSAPLSSSSDLAILDDLFEKAPCGYLVLDADGNILRINGTLLGWICHRRQDLLGKKMMDLLTTAGKVFYETNFIPLLRVQGACEELAFDLKVRDGSKLAVNVSATESRRADTTLEFIRVAVFKASQRRRYERELMAARNAADEAQNLLSNQNASLRTHIKKAVGAKRKAERGLVVEQETGELREQFVAVLGHDLRNPLGSITAATRLLANEGQTERAKQVIRLMEGSVSRMSGLIDNVLDFARGRLGGGIGLDRNATEMLLPTLKQVIDELRSSVPDRTITSKLLIEGSLNADHGRLGQMLSNLLGNAIRHGSESRPIAVHAEKSSDGAFTLWVSNGGEPIPGTQMDRLFEPFIRGESRGYQQGLGLGLHIASEIAKAHGGTLVATSTEKETRFTFEMPPSIAAKGDTVL